MLLCEGQARQRLEDAHTCIQTTSVLPQFSDELPIHWTQCDKSQESSMYVALNLAQGWILWKACMNT